MAAWESKAYACALCQESESAELFSRKSWWRDTCRSLGECWTATSQYTSLWKTAIQTIEGKHGAHHERSRGSVY